MLFCEPIPYLKSPIKCKTLVLLTLDWVSWKDELDKTWLVITRKYAQNYCTILSIFKKSFRVEVSLWFLFCSGQVFFERTPGSLLRPVQGTSLREDPWRPPASSSGDQSSRGPLAPSCVHTKLPFQDDVFAQGSPNSPHPQLHRFRFVWLHAIKKKNNISAK